MLEIKKALTIFCDGGARGNPGPGGIGVVVYRDGVLIDSISKFVGKKVTNNQAEYLAVIESLRKAKELQAGSIKVLVDSQLAQRQLTGIYKVKNALLRELWQKVKDLETEFKEVKFEFVPRESNKEADRLVNEVLDAKLGK
ncbi:ribonuclease HI family protein [Patescibacteria group bacterium]|nr:ribonuclease HI family protein [Patescibacteria group bacterium]MBU1868657.1 ribonuclease HI family protein [Patescibacteria group bacterium]